ncbi:MAG: galactose-1-phosphate uridylyltransferase [Candidatus Nealsonbacteria bacterium DGGOD1a]|jgi:galactose-1-phosphate uridylyltransferase, family 1|nr:MAG: galactose-1-phosphate uridylyltransferase [Candidatus Nealsonbacteria bacterium DGGOD1a]
MEQTENNNKCCPSQLRYDEVSRDWVVIAPGRGKRPEAFKRERIHSPITPQDCIFCNLEKQAPPIMALANGKKVDAALLPADWTLAVIPNKFPAFCAVEGAKICKQRVGPLYHSMDAAGFCEVVVTRSHEKHIALMDVAAVEELIAAYRTRYLDLKKRDFVKYISIFHNHGVEAGASQPHPHSQIITSPLIDVDVRNALANSKRYYQRNKKCISCEMTAWERKDKARIVYENKDFIATCPFAPKSAFQVIIAPKKHSPYFEKITPALIKSLADIFSAVMKKIYKGLGDPPYNFYLHTAPSDGGDYSFYHYHWTIMPKTSTMAGFEFGARIEISTITPESAAEYLRAQ